MGKPKQPVKKISRKRRRLYDEIPSEDIPSIVEENQNEPSQEIEIEVEKKITAAESPQMADVKIKKVEEPKSDSSEDLDRSEVASVSDQPSKQVVEEKDIPIEKIEGEKFSDIPEEVVELVCFKLGLEIFALNIQYVQEINRMTDITRVPHSAEYVTGISNLRGKIFPVIDLRKRFEISINSENDVNNKIIVIEIKGILLGMIVDSVTKVLRISNDKIKPVPDLITSKVDKKYINGFAKHEGHLLIILEPEKIYLETPK